MPYAECAECSRPTGAAAGECSSLHRCTLEKRMAPLCCECTATGIRKGHVKKPASENWSWIKQACRSCKIRKSTKCGGKFQKKTFSRYCICGLLEGDHEGLLAMFSMGMNARSTSPSAPVGSSEMEVLGDDARRSAALLSPLRQRQGPKASERVSAAFVSPRQQRGAHNTSVLCHVGSPTPIQGRPQSQYPPPQLISKSSPNKSPPMQHISGSREKTFPDYETTHAFEDDGDALATQSYEIPEVPSQDDLEAVVKRIESSSENDGQLLPEEAELLRHELQAVHAAWNQQHGELVELAEQKRNLEMRMEATVKHVVSVMSEEKRRLNVRITALEHERASLISNTHQMKALIETMRLDVQGKAQTIRNLKGRVQVQNEVARKAYKALRQAGEDSDVEAASSKSSSDISTANASRLEERHERIRANDLRIKELGEQVLEVAGRFAQIDRANCRMLSKSEETDQKLKDLRDQCQQLKAKEDMCPEKERILFLEKQVADLMAERNAYQDRCEVLSQTMKKQASDAHERLSSASTKDHNQGNQQAHWSFQTGGIKVLRCSSADKERSIPENRSASSPTSLSDETCTEIKSEHVELLDQIAEGSFGIIYKARWLSANVAVKKLRPPASSLTIEEVEALSIDFQREVLQLTRLRHPNILAFYGTIGKGGSELAIVTELMDGDMRAYLKTKASADSLFKRVSILREAACGIRYLHEESLVHRDIKPENFLLMHLKNITLVKLCDFGLTRIKEATHINTLRTGGTMMYIAPEVHRGDHFDERSDVYSFSIVMWELVTTQAPFADKPMASIPGIVGWGQQRPSCLILESVFTERFNANVPAPEMERIRSMESEVTSCISESWSHEPSSRPSIAHVVCRLEKALALVGVRAEASSQNGAAQGDTRMSLHTPGSNPTVQAVASTPMLHQHGRAAFDEQVPHLQVGLSPSSPPSQQIPEVPTNSSLRTPLNRQEPEQIEL